VRVTLQLAAKFCCLIVIVCVLVFQKMRPEDPHWLFTQYQQGSNLLLIDCRTLSEYAKGHIEGAINLFIPPLMLRRLKRGNVPLRNFINSEVAQKKFESRSSCEKVVLYDEDTSNISPDTIIDVLSNKLAETNSLVFLKGGFRQFEETFPHLCQCGEGTELNNAMFSLTNLDLNCTDDSREPVPSPMQFHTNNNAPTLNLKQPTAKDLLFRPDSSGPVEILPRLYLGNKVDSSSINLLRKARISHILNVTPDLPNAFEDNFKYLRLAVQDNWGGDLVSHFTEAYEFIDDAIKDDGYVLVHCLGGISRSSTIIIAYLMLKYDYSLNDAYDLVKSKKSNIAPNFNFMGQLLDLERQRDQFSTFCNSPGSISPGSMSTGSDLSTGSC